MSTKMALLERLHILQHKLFVSPALLLIVVTFLLTGCKEVLYSSLSENEANQMVAVLHSGGIQTVRERDKDGLYSLLVADESVPSAVSLLTARGYPRQQFASLGDVFAARGLVGTPFEERARFMHALNEELSRTIVGIEGVLQARVHVVIPQQAARTSLDQQAARASVMIAHDAGHDFSRHVASIKTLVAHAVPGLSYDDVAVALFPAETTNLPSSQHVAAVSFQAGITPSVQGGSSHILMQLSMIALAVGCLLLVVRMRRRLIRTAK